MTLNVRRRSMAVLLAALAGMVVTGNLGFWQLRRAAQKIDLQAALDSRGRLPELADADLARRGADAVLQLYYRRVHLQGRWVGNRTVFLENRQMNGRVGFYVVTPLQLAGRAESVLVQRGWVPRDLRDRTLLPPVTTPPGADIGVDGIIAPPPSRLYEFAPSSTGLIRQNLDLPAFASETGLRLLPVSVQQSGPPPPAPAGGGTGSIDLLREWPRPAVNVDMHYGYAFQWFALCALMAGLYVWFQLLQPWLGRRRRGPVSAP